jgi:hypothetical protein
VWEDVAGRNFSGDCGILRDDVPTCQRIGVGLGGRGEPARVATAGVSRSFFETLGAAPLLGRPFTPDDDRPHAPPVMILSYDLYGLAALAVIFEAIS